TGIDYQLSSSASGVTLFRGGSYKFTVMVSPLGGTFANAVALSCTGAPLFSACGVSPSQVVPGSAGASATVAITTNPGKTPTGSYTLTIGGASGGLLHSVSFQLVVTRH